MKETKARRNLKNQKAITLIALVISIIVLLILAAVAISALSGENGILSNATKAKQNNEKGEAEDSIKLILNEWSIEKYTGTKTLKEFLESKFTSVTDNGDGTYTVELKGYEATVDADGNIIGEITKAGPKPVIDESSIVITLEDGTKAGKLYNFTSSGTTALNWTESEIDGKNVMSITDTSSTGSYREPDTISSCDGDSTYLNIIKSILTDEESQSNYANKTSFKATMQSDFDDMIESISKYGGFYVARYEMTLSSEDKPQFIASTTTEFLKNSDAVSSTDTTTNKWYGLYARAKEYKTNSTQGSMIWGSQYDAMMQWMQDNGITVTSTTPTDTGTVNTTSKNTTRYPGSVENDRILNIYDLLGNSWEWTLEAYYTSYRAIRGGYYGDSNAPSFRYYGNAYNENGYYSARATLLIK